MQKYSAWAENAKVLSVIQIKFNDNVASQVEKQYPTYGIRKVVIPFCFCSVLQFHLPILQKTRDHFIFLCMQLTSKLIAYRYHILPEQRYSRQCLLTFNSQCVVIGLKRCHKRLMICIASDFLLVVYPCKSIREGAVCIISAITICMIDLPSEICDIYVVKIPP